MTLQSLGRPIENVEDLDEARVLAIVDHLAPLLDAWREGQDLEAVLQDTGANLAARRDGLAAAQASLQARGAEIMAAQGRRERLSMGIWAAIAVAALLLVVAPQLGFGLWLPLASFAVAGVLFLSWVQAGHELEVLKRQRVGLEKTAADLEFEVMTLAMRRATIDEERSLRGNGFPTVEMADVRFPLAVADVSGRSVLLDQSSSFAEVTLRAVDVSQLERSVSHIAEEIEGLLVVPPMLSHGSSSDTEDPLGRLYGEENELSSLVGDFSRSLGLLRDVELKLPIIPASNELARRVSSGETLVPAAASAIVVSQDAGEAARIEAFVAEANQSREHGRQVFADLTAAHDRLSAGCNLYASARQTSVNALHGSWLEVLGRANWCDRRFYCARTIMSPRYLEDLLGCPVDQAYRLSQDALVETLRSDPSINERLRLKPELEAQLRAALMGVHEFMDMGDDDGGHQLNRPRHIEDQLRECLLMFQRTLQKVMTGSAFPILNFSSEAILHYDPDTEEWSSDLSPHVYRTHEVLRYGSIVKAYSDLMIPLWEHLWTEKADFRRAETFRTNDLLIGMSEKEAEKLIDVANQFRDDLRSVRENLNMLGADLKSKIGEITSFKEGMDDLGVLSPRALMMIEQGGAELSDEEDDILTQADKFETILAAQPQTQMENRGTVQDPIELVRGVDALIVVDQAPHLRLRPA